MIPDAYFEMGLIAVI